MESPASTALSGEWTQPRRVEHERLRCENAKGCPSLSHSSAGLCTTEKSPVCVLPFCFWSQRKKFGVSNPSTGNVSQPERERGSPAGRPCELGVLKQIQSCHTARGYLIVPTFLRVPEPRASLPAAADPWAQGLNGRGVGGSFAPPLQEGHVLWQREERKGARPCSRGTFEAVWPACAVVVADLLVRPVRWPCWDGICHGGEDQWATLPSAVAATLEPSGDRQAVSFGGARTPSFSCPRPLHPESLPQAGRASSARGAHWTLRASAP